MVQYLIIEQQQSCYYKFKFHDFQDHFILISPIKHQTFENNQFSIQIAQSQFFSLLFFAWLSIILVFLKQKYIINKNMQSTHSQKNQQPKMLCKKQSQYNEQEASSIQQNKINKKVRPSKLQVISHVSKDNNDNPINFLGNIFAIGFPSNQISMEVDQLKSPSLLSPFKKGKSFLHSQTSRWEAQQNQHHFKQGKSMFINESLEEEQNQDQVFGNNNIFNLGQYLEQLTKNQSAQTQQFQPQSVNQIQKVKQLQEQNKYQIKIYSVQHQRILQNQLQFTDIIEVKTQNVSQIISQHFQDPDQNILAQLMKIKQQKQLESKVYLNCQQIDSISHIENTSYHQINQLLQSSFLSHFQQAEIRKSSPSIQQQQQKYPSSSSRARVLSSVQLKQKTHYQSIRTLKNKQFQQKSEQKQKTCIRQTRSPIIPSEKLDSFGQQKYKFKSFQFLNKMIQTNKTNNHIIKINEQLNMVNIQIIPFGNTQQKSKLLQNRTTSIIDKGSKFLLNKLNQQQNLFKKQRQSKLQSFQSEKLSNKYIDNQQRINKTQQTKSKKKRTYSMQLIKSRQIFDPKLNLANKIKNIKQINYAHKIYEKEAVSQLKKKTSKRTMSNFQTKNHNKISHKHDIQNAQKFKIQVNSILPIKYLNVQKKIDKKDLITKIKKQLKCQKIAKGQIRKQKKVYLQQIKDKNIYKHPQNIYISAPISPPNNNKKRSIKDKIKNQSYIGKQYQGSWKDGKRHGKGKLIISDNEFYEGTFEFGAKNGYGFQKLKNGDVYKGYYKNGKFQGQGFYKWNDGSSYQGQFKSGKINGYGKWKTSKQIQQAPGFTDKTI